MALWFGELASVKQPVQPEVPQLAAFRVERGLRERPSGHIPGVWGLAAYVPVRRALALAQSFTKSA